MRLTQLVVERNPSEKIFPYGRFYVNKRTEHPTSHKEICLSSCFSFYDTSARELRNIKKNEDSDELFVTRLDFPFEQDRSTLVTTIQKRMQIGRKGANQLKDKLFEEIDQLAENNEVEPISEDEKEQLILAVMKAADYLAKKTLELKAREG